ncbi:MAG: hypothetical protein OXC00_05495, partial [Acidimicrobiaceae bacterium]|nr:hypothetical protein [Acidimicrobiaceae bacterium]
EADKHISAMWELGVTGGAEALPPGPGRPHVLVNLTTRSFIDGDGDPATGKTPSPQATVVQPVPLSFNADGQATFSVSGLVDGAPNSKEDKYDIDVSILHFPPSDALGPYPLAYNYHPQGTVNRGEMAAFITRALAHTSVRPAGVTAQYDDHEDRVVVSVRDDDFQPVSNAVVDVFFTDTPGVDLAFRGDGSCGEVEELEGTYSCEIDKTDNITGGTGDSSLSLTTPDLDAVNGTTVWVWTGDDEDKVDVGETELYRLDIPGGISEPATLISVTNGHGGSKAHLGSSVLFTLQLRDKYGRATTGRYKNDLTFVAGNMAALAEATVGTAVFNVLSGNGDGAVNSGRFTGVFSTEDSLVGDPAVAAAANVGIRVGPNPSYVAADLRGAATRVTVTVVDQYGDPLPNREVRLRTARTTPASQVVDHDNDPNTPALIPIANDAHLAVDRSGSYTFGYERRGVGTAQTDTLTANVEPWDHDGDEAAADADGETGPLTPADASNSVQWASMAENELENDAAKQILRIDTDTNTIFVGTVTGDSATGYAITADSVEVVRYDSNDRFNIVRPAPAGESAAGYAQFERNLFNLAGFELAWDIAGTGSRDVNEFTLVIPAEIDPVIYW